MLTLDRLVLLSGLSADQLEAAAATLVREGVVRPRHAGRCSIREASCMVTEVSVAAVSRMAATIAES